MTITKNLFRAAMAALLAISIAICLAPKAQASFEFTTAKAEVNHTFNTDRNNRTKTLEATCPDGYTVVGGGFHSQSDNNYFYGKVRPISARRVSGKVYRVIWQYFYNSSSSYPIGVDDMFYLTAHAYCLQR